MSRIPRSQIGSLDTPGLAVYPVALSPADASLGKLLLALDLTGQAAGNLAEVDRQAKARDRQMEERATALDQGTAAQVSERILPTILDNIAKDQVPLNEDPLATARSILNEHTPASASDAFRTELEYRAVGKIQTAILNRRSERADASRKEQTSLVLSSATGLTDAAAITAKAAKLREIDPSLSDSSARQKVAIFGMNYAAAAGDRKAFEAAKAVLGPDEARAEQLVATQNLAEAEHEDQKVVVDRYNQAISGLYVDQHPFSEIKDAIRAGRGTVPDSVIDARLQEADSREQQAVRGADAAALRLEFQQKSDEILGGLLSDSMSADQTGGLIKVPERGFSWTDSSGQERHISRDEAVDLVTNQAMTNLAAETPDAASAIREQAFWLSANGVTNPLWRRTLEAGFMTNVDAVLRQTADGKPVALPAAMTQGYQLWKSLSEDSRLRERHATAETAAFYGLAEIAEKYTNPGDEKAALLRAVNAARLDPAAVHASVGVLKDDQILAATKWADGTVNGPDIRSDVKRTAALLMQTGAPDPATAVTEAAKMVERQWSKVGGAMIFTADRSIPSNFAAMPDGSPGVADFVIDRYFKKFGKDEDLSRDNLTMYQDRAGVFHIFDTATQSDVESPEGVLTKSDLFEADAARREQHKQELVDAANAPSLLERGAGGVIGYTSNRPKMKPDPLNAKVEQWAKDINNK